MQTVHPVHVPASWHEVTTGQYIALQAAEENLLPIWGEMKNVKARHDALNAACEDLLFSSDPFADLEIQAHKTEMETLQARFDELTNQYSALTAKRVSILCNLPQADIALMPLAEVERLIVLCNMLYSQPLEPQPPEKIGAGLWAFRTSANPAAKNVKTVFYCRHLAEYPTCIHQVYHTLLKQIRQLAADADAGRTEAELKLAALFVIPRPDGLVYLIAGNKPDKIDFDSGRFNECLQDFWSRQQQTLSAMPITLLKGIAAFFLPHWKSYFASRSLMPTTLTDTEMC